ncbi:hypothetical protein [Nostoc sp.]
MSGLRGILWTVYTATIPIPTLRNGPLKSYCEQLSIAKYVHLETMPNEARWLRCSRCDRGCWSNNQENSLCKARIKSI